jgi:hypothetical protein
MVGDGLGVSDWIVEVGMGGVGDGLVVSDSIVGVGMGGVGVGLVTGRPVGVGIVVEPGGVGCAETDLGVVRPGPTSNATGGSNIP